MKTPEEIGYQDAMRQVLRSLQRRLKTLQDEKDDNDRDDIDEIRIRENEVKHLISIVESLHR